MKTPFCITLDAFREQLISFLLDRCDLGPITPLDHGLTCIDCGQKISMAFPYVSIHTLEFSGCTGYGTVEHPPIPYCSKCEPAPESSGCVHVPHQVAKVHIASGKPFMQGLLAAIPLTLLHRPPPVE